MALPDQVQRQSEAAAKFYTEILGDESGDQTATLPVIPVVTPAPTVPVATVPPAAASEPPPAGDLSTENYEQKYRSLQGMFNVEVPKLNAQIKELQAKNVQMTDLMASLHTVPAPTAMLPAQKLVTDTDVAEYGDSIEMMRKVSREELHSVFAEIASLKVALNNLATSMNTSVLPQVQRVAQRQVMSDEDRFWSDLQRDVPDWQQTNNDSDFKSWLLSVDDLTGQTRQSYLEQAQRVLDVNRVIAFFRAYATVSGKKPAPPAAQPSRSASELELQIAPGRSRGGQPPVNPTAKTYSPADITKFYDDVRKGVYKGREPERNQIEADIFSARKDNRIVANA